MKFLLIPSLKYAQHTCDVVKRQIKIYSVGRTENHKLISVIIPEGYR